MPYDAHRNWETGQVHTVPRDVTVKEIYKEFTRSLYKCGYCLYSSTNEPSAVRHCEKSHTGPVVVSRIEEVVRLLQEVKVEPAL